MVFKKSVNTKLKTFIALFVLLLLFPFKWVSAQMDTVYVTDYPETVSLRVFTGMDGFLLSKGSKDFSPNYPLLVGLGLTIKNTLVDFGYSQSLIPLKGKAWGKSRVIDFQIHKFTRNMMFDLSFLRYKGFYRETEHPKIIETYPQLGYFQVGAEFHYLFGGGKLSLQAAFDGLKIQAKSTGSFTLGGSVHYSQLNPGNAFTLENLRKAK